jgi:hypothetical protein
MNTIFQNIRPIGYEALKKGRWEKILQETTEIMGRFTESAGRLMADALVEMGFTVKTNQEIPR